jgi:hypothetical protein
VTSTDSPQPPGSPLRQDAPEGEFAPDSEREDLPPGGSDGSEADDTEEKAPPITHEPEQGTEAAIRQEENAETSQDQPSQ